MIVGASIKTMTFAEKAATLYEKTNLIVEKRKRIGGNSYDCYDDYGIIIHQYGKRKRGLLPDLRS